MGDNKKVVSRNYRDRDSKLRWLVRGENEEMHKASAINFVYATGVSFKASSELEEGFGCTIIASCDKVANNKYPPMNLDLVPLRFDYNQFRDDETGKRVNCCSHLVLKENGSVWAVIED